MIWGCLSFAWIFGWDGDEILSQMDDGTMVGPRNHIVPSSHGLIVIFIGIREQPAVTHVTNLVLSRYSSSVQYPRSGADNVRYVHLFSHK